MEMKNAPILVVQSETIGVSDVTLSVGDRGIFAPFKGIFLLKVQTAISAAASSLSVKVSNIYGDSRPLHIGNSSVKGIDLGVGIHACCYDTDAKKLYLLGGKSMVSGTYVLSQSVSLQNIYNTELRELLFRVSEAGVYEITAKVQFLASGGTSRNGVVEAILCNYTAVGKTVTIVEEYDSAESSCSTATLLVLHAILELNVNDQVGVVVRASTASEYNVAYVTTQNHINCTRLDYHRL